MKKHILSLLGGMLISASSFAELQNFITRDGATLMDGNEVFRFAGIHSPELHRIEDDARGACSADARGWGQHFKWPTADEQENWIKSMARVGQKATRIYVLSIEQQYDAVCGRETHILAPLTQDGMPRFNEEAMVHYDRMIALADEHDVRLIVPFIDHWEWWGGRKQLAAFYGETEADFYDTSSKTYAAYKYIIEQLITRTNTITGRPYSEEKSILSWETGNELRDTNQAFLDETVAHIKSLDSNHLIQDGTYTRINSYALTNPDIDIISNHYYTNVGNNNPEQVLSDLQEINGEKVYLVGEFGLLSASDLNAIMQSIVNSEHNGAKAAGGLVWGLRGHRHNGGFYWHQEYTGHYSYHYPGFPDGDANQEQDVVDLVRNAQAQMLGLPYADALPVPEAPKLRAITSTARINWMGAPVGRFYRVERATHAAGPWTTIGENISDGKNRYDPTVDSLFSDPTAQAGSTYYYRVYASNESGESEPSNIQVATAPQAVFFEAEAATLSEGMVVSNINDGYSGSGYATGMESNRGRVTWTIQAEEAGIYDAAITYAVDQTKENALIVNGQSRTVSFAATGGYDQWQAQSIAIELQQGANQIAIAGGWGYTDIDHLIIYGLEGDPVSNTPPTIVLGDVHSEGLEGDLSATVSDDGLPLGGSLQSEWSFESGPGSITFADHTQLETSFSASEAGTYSVKLNVHDGELSSEKTQTFSVSETVQNQAPEVTVSATQNAKVNDSVSLNAFASDDGLPNGVLNYVWTYSSGPDNAFNNDAIQDRLSASASFIPDVAGTYQFQVQVDDEALSTQAVIAVIVGEVDCSSCGNVTNLALNGVATVSSTDGYAGGAGALNDGDGATRWASAWSDDEWLTIDLLNTYALSQINLQWESAYAANYEVQTSIDGTQWSVVHVENNGSGGQEIVLLNEVARFVKVQGVSRATQWGYSLWEVEVLGSEVDDAADFLTVEPSQVDFSAQPSATTFNVLSNTEWTAYSDQAWLTLGSTEGEGNATVDVQVEANTGQQRMANVQVTAGDIERTIVMTQAAEVQSPTGRLEAELAALTGLNVVSNSAASGGEYVNMQGEGKVEWRVNMENAGAFEVTVGYRVPYGSKTQRLIVNDVAVGNVVFDGNANQWLEKTLLLDLAAGDNSIAFEKSWGWMHFDFLSF